jgi:hypothetical protein
VWVRFPPRLPNNPMQYILIIGDPQTGHRAYGPFYSELSAESFAEKHEFKNVRWEIIPLNVGI